MKEIEISTTDRKITAAVIAILAFIGMVALSKIYIFSTFDILIKAYLDKEDVMIRKDAAQYCCECETIFEFGEGKLGCPCCGNRSFISVNQLLKAKEQEVEWNQVDALPKGSVIRRRGRLVVGLQDGRTAVTVICRSSC